MLNLILFGPPGAGKGTQSLKIVEKYNLQHLSTGDMLRSAIQQNSPLGRKAKEFMDEGRLVPDEMVIDLIASVIDSNASAKGFVFDGFPRTTLQATKLDGMLEKRKSPIRLLISLEVDYDELIARLVNRGKVCDRTDDQDENVIRGRIDIYNKTTLPVMDYYKAQGKLRSVSGMGSVDEIFMRICQVIDSVA
jgi:adenylate kinase